MKRSFPRRLVAVLVLGYVATAASAQMYGPQSGYYQPYGYPAYNPYYGYGRPAMQMNYYQPVPVMPSAPMMTSVPAQTLPATTEVAPSPTTPVTAPVADPTPVMMRRSYMPLPNSPMIATDSAPGCCGGSLPEPTACGDAGHCGSECIQRDCCNPCCRDWTFDLGGSANILRPYHHSNPTFFVLNTTATTPNVGTASDFDWNWSVSPTIWAEITSPSGIGVRAKYFRFDQSSNGASTTISGPVGLSFALPAPLSPNPAVPLLGAAVPTGSTLTVSSNLQLQTIDIEGTYNFRPEHWLLTLIAGSRYMDTQQNYASTATTAAGALIETLQYHQSFAGAGPLVGFEFHRYIGLTGLTFYGKVDGALLVGTGFENIAQVFPVPLGPAANNLITSNHNPLLPIADIELGAEYIFNRSGKFHPFLRAAVVDQTYWDIGSASSRNGNMSLFGGQFSGGFSF